MPGGRPGGRAKKRFMDAARDDMRFMVQEKRMQKTELDGDW